MRYSIASSYLIIFTLCYSNILKSQIIAVPDTDNSVSLHINGLDGFDPNPDFARDPFIKLLWFFGDGKIELLDGPDLALNPGPYNSAPFDHCYSNLLNSYEVHAIPIDKKSDDDEPPGVTLFNSTIPPNPASTAPCIVVPFPGPIIGGTPVQVDLAINPFLRKKRVTSFVLTYKPPPGGGELLFFFDGETRTGSSNLFDYEDSHIPNYFNEPIGDVIARKPIESVPSIIPGFAAGYYESVLSYAISTSEPNSFVASGLDEMLVAHFLEGTDNLSAIENGETAKYQFLTILAGTGQTPTSTPIPDEIKPFVSDGSIAGMEFGEVRGTGGLYYVGHDFEEDKTGDPEDPSKLKVYDICKCQNNENKKEVEFELTFCNEKDALAKGAFFGIHDIEDKYCCFKITDFSVPIPTIGSTVIECSSPEVTSKFNLFKANASISGAEEKFCKDNFELQNMHGEGGEALGCGKLRFKAIVNGDFASIEDLTTLDPTNEFPIKVCVQLIGEGGSNIGGIFCADRYALHVVDTPPSSANDEIWENREHFCDDDACKCGFFWWWLAGGLILLLVFTLGIESSRKWIFRMFNKK